MKKKIKGSSPTAKQSIQTLGMQDPAEVLSSGVNQAEQRGYASSCSSVEEEEGEEQMSDVVHELEEEVQRLHDQVTSSFWVQLVGAKLFGHFVERNSNCKSRVCEDYWQHD